VPKRAVKQWALAPEACRFASTSPQFDFPKGAKAQLARVAASLAKWRALNAPAQITCGFAALTSTPRRLIALNLRHLIESFEPFRIIVREGAVIV
jgi:hypothetical protein